MPAVRRLKLLLLAMLTMGASCALAQAGEVAAARTADTSPTPSSSMPSPADEQVLAAVAAVLVATFGAELDGDMLELKLGDAAVTVEGPREHVVQGAGALRFGDGKGDDWLAFRYQTRYDPLFSSAGYPQVSLGGNGQGADERFIPNDARLLAELEARVGADLEALPGAGRVFLQLDEVSSLQSGTRFLHIEARGLADFGPGGRTGAQVDALYDLHAGAWLTIAHELAPNIQAHDDGGTAGP